MKEKALSAAELSRRVRRNSSTRITAELAEQFLADWLERGLVHQPSPGHYALTARGRKLAAGLRHIAGPEQEAAA